MLAAAHVERAGGRGSPRHAVDAVLEVAAVAGGSDAVLVEVGLADDAPGEFAGAGETRQEDRHERRDDRDDHEQLDQGEGSQATWHGGPPYHTASPPRGTTLEPTRCPSIGGRTQNAPD